MEKDKVQNDKVQSNDEISSEDLDKVAGGFRLSVPTNAPPDDAYRAGTTFTINTK